MLRDLFMMGQLEKVLKALFIYRLLLAVLPILMISNAIAQEKGDADLFYQGQTLVEKQQPKAAAVKFNNLLEQYPDSNIRDLALFWLGRVYLELGQTPKAQETFQKLRREYPESPLVLMLKREIAAAPSKPPGEVAKAVPPKKIIKPSEPPKTAKKPVKPEGVQKKPSEPVRKSAGPRKTKPAVTKTLPIPSGGVHKGFTLTITQVADLRVESKRDRLQIYPGESGVIPLRIINAGNAEDSFSLRTTLPPEYQPVFYADTNGNGRPDTGERPIQSTPPLDMNGGFSVLLQIRVPKQAADGLTKEFEVLVFSKFDPNIAQLVKASATARGPLIRADFKVDKGRVRPGDRLSFTLILENTGSAEAREVKFQYGYHPNLVFLSADPTPHIVEQVTRMLAWKMDTLPSGATRQMKVHFKVGDEARAGQDIVNHGSLDISAGGEPMLLASPIVVVRQVAMVKLEGSQEEMAVTPGDVLDLPYVIKNTGNGADGFRLRVEGSDVLEALVYHDQNNDGLYQLTEPVLTETPELASREAFPVMVRIKVPLHQSDGQKLEARLIARSKLDQAVFADTTKLFHYTLPIVNVSTQQGSRESVPGGIISYQLTAINSGSGIARDVVITDLLPAELQYVHSDPEPFKREEGDLEWRVAELAPNQKKVFIVNLKTRPGLRAGTVIQKETRIRYSDLNGNRYQ